MRNFNASSPTIALLPLDNRPPNYDFPAQLARIAGAQLLLPPREFLGDLHCGAQRDSLERWLLQLPRVDALIVSIDALAFGGLAQSRQIDNKESIDSAKKRLKVLLAWREKYPETPFYAFNSIMRLGITMDKDAVAPLHFNLQRYSRLIDEADVFDSDYLRDQLAQVTAQIAPKVLSYYHAMRQRNHQINRWAIENAAAQNWDFLSIVQEDCAEFGLHRAEQRNLSQLIAELNIHEKTSLHPGTDEAALILLARALHDKNHRKSTFAVHWSEADGAVQIPQFEDRPFGETLTAQLRAAGCQSANADTDFELFINAPLPYSRARQTPEQIALRKTSLQKIVRKIQEAINNGKHVALCDAAFPNGADDTLLALLDRHNLLGKLCAFAAWNTASNALGTVIAQCTAYKANQFTAYEYNRQFVLERILDDWIYQTRLRPQLQKQAQAAGVSSLNLGSAEADLRQHAERELRGYNKLIAQRHFHKSADNLQIDFPWHRIFEITLK